MNTLRVLLVISTISIVSCQQGVHEVCMNGVKPLFVPNSPYSILPNGSLCCPPLLEDSNCSSEKDMQTKCPDGLLIDEPCFFCMTCAKRLGEICGGAYGTLGRCNRSLECNAHELTFLSGQNITGVCVTKATKEFGEPCGGTYGIVGRCKTGLNCTADESKYANGENVTGICLESDAAEVCFKNCDDREIKFACGSDGRWYKNKCHLRQQNCYPPRDSPNRTRPEKDDSICRAACSDINLNQNGHIDYTAGVKSGSEASFFCHTGYESTQDEFRLKCNNRKWMEILEDGNLSSREWNGNLPFCLPALAMDHGFNRPS